MFVQVPLFKDDQIVPNGEQWSTFDLRSFIYRSSHQRCSISKGVVRNLTKFIGKHMCQSLFFNKVAGLLLKKRLWHRCFPVDLAKFLRTPFSYKTPPVAASEFIISRLQNTSKNMFNVFIHINRVSLKNIYKRVLLNS